MLITILRSFASPYRTVIIPTLQKRKLRRREEKSLAQGCTVYMQLDLHISEVGSAYKWGTVGSEPSTQALRSMRGPVVVHGNLNSSPQPASGIGCLSHDPGKRCVCVSGGSSKVPSFEPITSHPGPRGCAPWERFADFATTRWAQQPGGAGDQVLAWRGSGPHSTKPGPLPCSPLPWGGPPVKPAETAWRASAQAT